MTIPRNARRRKMKAATKSELSKELVAAKTAYRIERDSRQLLAQLVVEMMSILHETYGRDSVTMSLLPEETKRAHDEIAPHIKFDTIHDDRLIVNWE